MSCNIAGRAKGGKRQSLAAGGSSVDHRHFRTKGTITPARPQIAQVLQSFPDVTSDTSTKGGWRALCSSHLLVGAILVPLFGGSGKMTV